MEPILKIWYDSLKENKILGLKCTRCGSIEFPPVPVCNECGCMEMEWIEMCGEAEIISFANSIFGIQPYIEEASVCGFGRVKEGPLHVARIVNATKEDESSLFENLPIPARLVVEKLDEDVYFPCYSVSK